jgi:hypothetical protein
VGPHGRKRQRTRRKSTARKNRRKTRR